MNVWKDASLGDSDTAEKFVQFFIVADSQLDVTRDDSRFLVVTCCIACEFENFGSEVFEDGSKIDGGACSDASCVFALLKETTHSSDWELESSLGRF